MKTKFCLGVLAFFIFTLVAIGTATTLGDSDGDCSADRIEALPALIESLNLQKGIENSLLSKVENAQASLESGDDNAAINKLNAFINEVKAQKGKKISKQNADMLIEFANNVIDWITLVYPVECTCSSCADCEAKLNDTSCDIVKLTADIIDHSGICINNPSNFNNKTFDCQGYMIDGTDLGSSIYLNGKNYNWIKNCLITDFSYGIYLNYSSGNTISSNIAQSNGGAILLMFNSTSNSIANNILTSNNYGVSLDDSPNNSIQNNTVSSSMHAINLWLSNVVSITNNTLDSNLRGISSYYSSGNFIAQNRIDSNYGGIYLESSSRHLSGATFLLTTI